MAEQKLSLGRTVHFVDASGGHHPSVITRVLSNKCANITVFFDLLAMPFPYSAVDHSEEKEPGTFHWPERE